MVEFAIRTQNQESIMRLAEIMTSLDRDEDGHLGRLLLLLYAFSRNEGKPAIEGITKLAKLDFLLRYPSYFERAMRARDVKPQRIPIANFERNTVEAQMVRYRFGPWDHRYRRFLNILAAKGLIEIATNGRTILLSLTEEGRRRAERLACDEAFRPLAARARLLRDRLDIGASEIMRFIYKTFPEIATLSYDEAIAS
ncbi:MAG TPA: hypothetical protein VF193_12725 [Steroidobacter sp.]